jgi:hypothetical protein
MYKKRLNLYHLISRSTYGVMVHIFAGLITYLLMAIYCAEEHGECVNMKRRPPGQRTEKYNTK